MENWNGRLIDLLRHGEPAGGQCFRGSRDDSLTERGWRQLIETTANQSGYARIISSPARRCAEFAQHLANARALPLTIDPRWRERHFGVWEGLTVDQIPTADLARFWANPCAFDPPQAEPFALFRARVRDAWRALCAESTRDQALLISHGGVIRAILAEVLQMPNDAMILVEVALAGLTRIRIPPPPGRASLVWHLPAPQFDRPASS